MPLVTPFRAVRPRPVTRDRLSPPYDVITPGERERLARDPHNPVHAILPRDDAGPGSRYAAAARTLEAWRREGVLARDPSPAYYPYEQRFAWGGAARVRLGFFGLLEVAPFGTHGVYPHERTLTGPREDRYRLLQATRTNLSAVFVLYEDPRGEVKAALESARARAPLARCATAEGEEALWSLPSTPDGTPEGACLAAGARAVARTLAGQGLVFADGHHRYESALRYRDGRRAEPGAPPPPQAYDFTLACFVDAADPGLLVLPTHRVVRGLEPFPLLALAHKLEGVYAYEPLGETVDPDEIERRAGAFLERHPAGAFVVVPAGEPGVGGFALAPGAAERAFAGTGVAPLLARVDAVQLSELVLARALGISGEKLAAQSHVEYVKSTADAIRIARGLASRGGEVVGAAGALPPNAAFLIHGTPVRQVMDVARAGLRMPQKTTYFLPKITTGWVYHVHEAPEVVWGDPGWMREAVGGPAPPSGPPTA